LLRYLEDIIGTLEFVPKIEEASKVVEQLNEQRTEHANRARAVEKEKEGLQGAKEEAEQFISLELQVCEKRAVQYQHQMMVNKRKAEQKLKLKEELEAKVKAERERVSALHKSLSDAEGNFKKLTKEKDVCVFLLARL
jgi:structural maintenance of chromosome 4